MSTSYDCVVVGAGITGASTASHLLREGAGRVLLLERDLIELLAENSPSVQE